MSRRMSCALTIDAVRNRTKTVTRRDWLTWRTLKPGDRLTLVEKAMGLPKGARQVVLAEVEIVDVRLEPLTDITEDEITAEGFNPHLTPPTIWAAWWAAEHGHRTPFGVTVRRIEWRYLP